MRLFLALILASLASAAHAVAAATYDVTIVNTVPQPAFSLTSTETTVTFTDAPSRVYYVQVVCDQAWGWADTTTTFANKFPVPANQAYTFKVDHTTTLYIQASTTTGNMHVSVLSSAQTP